MVSCINRVQESGILGTWNYRVDDAPFGFQSGKVIFYNENDSVKAKIKFFGISIPAEDLKIDGDEISMIVPIEHENTLIRIKRVEDKFTGNVIFSDGNMSIILTKQGRKNSKFKQKVIDKKQTRGENKESIKVLKDYLSSSENKGDGIDYRVHTFYYGWYGNPETNSEYIHWSGSIIPHWIDTTWNDVDPYPGGDDISANFFPQMGNYSSTDPETISTHVQQIRDAGIGVIVLSWWGMGDYTDQSVQTMLDTAQQYGLKIAFHLEPFYKTTEEFRTHLTYISEKYLQHPALYKPAGKPLYYLYNPFQLNYQEWDSLLNKNSSKSIRNTSLDGYFIGLWTTQFDGEFALQSSFDGVYTYFVSDGFAFGSTTTNWPEMAKFTSVNNLLFIPCAGPGYADTRIRPWNEKNTKARENGKYYEDMFKKAAALNPDFLGITSFNEWHEGTQIEPAIPKQIESFTYRDYGKDNDPLFYIKETKKMINSLAP
jgi:glycoprotein endo-alpha-1,2-mannosidase